MKGTLTFFFVAIYLLSFGQSNLPINIDNRLKEIYTTSHLEQLKQTNPQLLARLNFYLDHAFIITEQTKEKPATDLDEVIIDDLENFNILELEKHQNLTRDWNKLSIYKIRGTDKLLVYHSGRNFNSDFQKYFKKNFK